MKRQGRFMRANRIPLLAVFLIGARLLPAQVVASLEMTDPALRALQEQSFNNLKAVGQNITGYQFNFPFYLSRKLDIDEKVQKRTDQHSIRFEHYNGSTVIAISGNYYAAYAADKFNEEQRARQTFQDVVVPILKAAVPTFEGDTAVQGYAVEVSHHVISKTMGMPIERPENLMVYLPQAAAVKLVAAQTNLAMQGALLDADVLLNAKQLSIWLTDEDQASASDPALPSPNVNKTATPPVSETVASSSMSVLPSMKINAGRPPDLAPTSPPPPLTLPPPLPPAHDASPQALATLQSSIQGTSNHMLKELDSEAHFVTYAPPAFIPFHRQVYLELSMTTTLTEPSDASRYKLAALAFDEHISPLIRRVLTYFKGDQNFDGISFSTTIRPRIKPGTAAAKALSVEFFFPLDALRRYESYDCTGQQLMNEGIVLINGERAGLDLELAQGTGQP
jgi:hypothetical protein